MTAVRGLPRRTAWKRRGDYITAPSAGNMSVAEREVRRRSRWIRNLFLSYVRWGERMPDYRIYWLDQDNRISGADDLTIDTDEAALVCGRSSLRNGSSDGGLARGAAHWARVRKQTARANFLTDGSRSSTMRLRGSAAVCDRSRSKSLTGLWRVPYSPHKPVETPLCIRCRATAKLPGQSSSTAIVRASI